MRIGKKRFFIRMIQTGVLLVMAGILLFLYQIPWKWMQENVPLLTYGSGSGARDSVLCKVMTEHIPLYTYAGCDRPTVTSLQSKFSREEIVLLEARDEDTVAEEMTDVDTETEIEEEKQELFNRKMEEENSAVRETEGERKKEGEKRNEEQPVMADSSNIKTPQLLSMEQYKDFDLLLRDFYVVDKSTYISAEELNYEKMLNQDLRLESVRTGREVNGPQVLIYHTHSQEAYLDSVPGDKSMTVVGAGEKLAALLEEEYAKQVLHHTGEYDVAGRDYAYANVEPQLESLLREYPTIEVVIDLHRDGVAENTHLVTEIDGKPTAQFMFFNGLSRLKSTGEIEYLKNENRQGNLAFSFQLQVKCMEYYPGLARSIYLKGYRYNMQYKEKSLLVELGAQTNTVEEIHNAIGPLAHVIAMVLCGE